MPSFDYSIRGNLLKPEDKRYVLSAYVHRFTKEHRPQWASQLRPNGKPYPVQFASDEDWLANTDFPIGKGGKLKTGQDVHCESHPTWPDNPELRKA